MQRLRTELNGVTLAERSAGTSDKPAMLLLHGWPQTNFTREKVLDVLGRQNFVLAFNLPGVVDSIGSRGG
jgi:pimeloyl-ACP methyl ester carboxylesterase